MILIGFVHSRTRAQWPIDSPNQPESSMAICLRPRMEEHARSSRMGKRKHEQKADTLPADAASVKKQRTEDAEGSSDTAEWCALPPELWFHIFSLLPSNTLMPNVGSVCHEWY